MNKLSDAIKIESKKKTTENGAVAYSELNNPILTFFGSVGGMRKRDDAQIIYMFKECIDFNKELSIKMLFYIGDVRGGLGERKIFNLLLNWMAKNYPDLIRKNIGLIPYYNRWDAIYSLINTPVEKFMWSYVRSVWQKDIIDLANGNPCSLLAKWLKSVNSSSEETKRLGKYTAKSLWLIEEEYRKSLSLLRNQIKVTEKLMSSNEWKSIEYDRVPSYAMKNYRDAFKRHDEEGFTKFIEEVKKGKSKINSSTLYPYDIVKPYTDYLRYYPPNLSNNDLKDEVLEQQWKALPNYLENDDTNVMCMVDVSGSMYGRPIASSIGLGIYFAQHNHGAFHNQFMTFTNCPHFITIKENESLLNIVQNVMHKDIGYSTNLEAAFTNLLSVAIRNNVPQEDMPKALIVISDMEIDKYANQESVDFMEAMRQKYEEAGYELPKLIFFQVEARKDTFLTLNEDALFISGQSAAAFKNVIANIEGTAWDLVINTLCSDRYEKVKI